MSAADHTLTVTTPSGSYAVIVESGALARLPTMLETLGLHGGLWLICDSAIEARYALPLAEQLEASGRSVRVFAVTGETSKDLSVAMKLYTWMIAGGIERRDTVLALGGGVVGDLAGFVAATVLRGVAFIQLPTTLLAMVDSAIGGKTGVNHPLGKNLIGAFHQPRVVLSDTDLLVSLPARELNSGWAEVIKHGVIRDAGLFEELESGVRSQESGVGVETPRWGVLIAALIRRAAKVKIDIVNIDERETGERMLLNYGHTLGHAVEAAAGYGVLLHGEAIAIGMDLEAQLAQQLGMVDSAFVKRQRALLQAYGLPTRLPQGMQPHELLALTLRDKKVKAGNVRWVLPTGLGIAIVRDDVPEVLVRTILIDQP
ncbi:MAG: 3-dehydroquinate synthase [Roseiflexaceae bacterium]|nr:3-dehydroquinate synthase [Roseiflexaceae bacterium]